MKRMPKQQEKEAGKPLFVIEWEKENYHTGACEQFVAFYTDEKTAELAFEIAQSHKTKLDVTFEKQEWGECPIDISEQPPLSGVEWDGHLRRFVQHYLSDRDDVAPYWNAHNLNRLAREAIEARKKAS